MINHKLRVFLLCLLYKIWYLKRYEDTDPKNQIILFLSCRPTDHVFFVVLPVDQEIDLVSPNFKTKILNTFDHIIEQFSLIGIS